MLNRLAKLMDDWIFNAAFRCFNQFSIENNLFFWRVNFPTWRGVSQNRARGYHPRRERYACSMAGIQTMYNTALLMGRFCATVAVNPQLEKNQKHVKDLLMYGTIAG